MNNNNTVKLIGMYGGDIEHALSAWTSTSRELNEEKLSRIPKLLTMLATDGHHTPFEKSSLHFLVTTEIATHIQLLKHRVGVSCVSGDTIIYLPAMNGKVNKRTISELYKTQENGIVSYSKNGIKYNRRDPRQISVRSKEIDTDYFINSYINKILYNGKKELYEFTTESGKKIKCTEDHKFFSSDRLWVPIKDLLVLEKTNNIATFKNKNCYIATNGVHLNNIDKPWSFRNFFEPYENTHSRKDVSNITGINYNTIKKWGYIHNIKFLEDINKNFKKNNVPWNKEKYGYSIQKKKNGINPNINKNLDYKIWRATVGNWTKEQLPKLLQKFSYTCQAQITDKCSRDFVCHHILTVKKFPQYATNIDNLLLVCSNCHKKIHSSLQIEEDFAMNKNSFIENIKTVYANKEPKKSRKLSINFEKIIKVEYIGIDHVYDLEVKNTHNYVANGIVVHNCNAESARYKELKEDKYYIPFDWTDEEELNKYVLHMKHSLSEYHECLARLKNKGFSVKRAKESARFYLPYGNQITADVMFNFRSFYHFLKLRYSKHAQREISNLAKEMLQLVKQTGVFDITLKAFGLVDEEGNIRGEFE